MTSSESYDEYVRLVRAEDTRAEQRLAMHEHTAWPPVCSAWSVLSTMRKALDNRDKPPFWAAAVLSSGAAGDRT